MREFERLGKSNIDNIFSELCFCLLTANFTAEGGIRIQKALEREFHDSSKEELSKKLRFHKHRFPNKRAEYICEARIHKEKLKEILKNPDDKEIRNWLAKNVKGLGMKESSHFLRNIGRKNVAIIDFHIIDLLVKNNLIEKPKTITPKKYLEIEKILEKLSKKFKLNLAELDLYLWFLETGKILK